MTQLEEFLAQREKIQQRMAECRAVAFDRAAPADRQREARKRFSQLSEMLEDLDVQIRALEPAAIPASRRKERQSAVSLNQPTSTGNELLMIVPALQPPEDEDEGSSFAMWRRLVIRAAWYLTPRQAEALELRYNKGYSVQKVADKMGISKRSASRAVRKAISDLYLWTGIFLAAGGCQEDDGFHFDSFMTAVPYAFPRALWEIILTLYRASPGEFPSVSALARATGVNYAQLCRRIGWIRSLCELYGVPLEGCHPLIRNSRYRKKSPEDDMRQLNRFYRSNYGYYGKSRAGKYGPRDEIFRHKTVEEAVASELRALYVIEHIPDELIAEALGLFAGDRLELARKRIDQQRPLKECGENVAKRVRTVIEVSALYAYFRYDTQRIFALADPWPCLFERWQCFPPAVERALRMLLDDPGISTALGLAERLGISDTNALKALRKAAAYCKWWGVPESILPELVRRYQNAAIEQSANTFQRVVRRKTGNAGSQGVKGRAHESRGLSKSEKAGRKRNRAADDDGAGHAGEPATLRL